MNGSRRGGVYVLVLIVSVVVVVMGVGSLLLRDRAFEGADRRADAASARALARSAGELAFQSASDGTNLEVIPQGFAWVNHTLGDGSLEAYTTGVDGNTVTVRGEGTVGEARAFLDYEVVTGADYLERAMRLEPAFHWPLDEGVGTESGGVDELIVGHGGTWAWFAGICGRETGPDGGPAPELDSISSSAGIANHGDMESDAVTVAAWVWLQDARTDTRVILSKDANGNGRGEFTVYVNNNRVYANIQDGSGVINIGGAGIVMGTWTHVAVRLGDRDNALFVNGALVQQDSSFRPDTDQNTQPLYIGVTTALSGSLSNPLYGSARDVSFFDEPLDDDEIADLAGDGWDTTLSPPWIVAGSWRWGVE